MCKRRVGVVFGGRSAEHEVSCKSAAYVMRALDVDKYQPVYIGITKDGDWKLYDGPASAVEEGDWLKYTKDFALDNLKKTANFIFPVLHGPFGEDGTIQGLLEMLDIPYAGCGVLASALAMDKAVFKDILRVNNLPTCKYLAFGKTQITEDFNKVQELIEEKIGFPCFVKPSNMGSSVGISKVYGRDTLRAALRVASAMDSKVVVEEYVPAEELEVAVLGNNIIETSLPGEIIPKRDFYDYDAKYSEENEASKLIIPAELPKDICENLRDLAIRAFKAIDGTGFGRIDFFRRRDDKHIYINEINTIPGFTDKSMFPLLWQIQGKNPGEIIERIIDLGYERYYSKNCR